MTLFTMPQGEIENYVSACDVVNVRADWEKIFPPSWNLWLSLFFHGYLYVVNSLFFSEKHDQKIFKVIHDEKGSSGCKQCIQLIDIGFWWKHICSDACSDQFVYVLGHVGRSIFYHFYCYLYTDFTPWHVNPVI